MRALIVGTGPSLSGQLNDIRRFDGLIFCCNNTPDDLLAAGVDWRQIVWLACDPKWHEHYGDLYADARFAKWHWDADICYKYGYTYVEGIWVKGLWLRDKTKISLNHGSAPQLINLAANQYASDEIILIGHDFRYDADKPRHYFAGLSDVDGEYPEPLRKWSEFDKKGRQYDLLTVYREIADTPGRPPIWNATPDSALPWFPMREFAEFLT